jgi:hypothetical protein
MCDDVMRTVRELRRKGAEFDGGIKDVGFGRLTHIRLPSGATLPMYEPTHLVAADTSR